MTEETTTAATANQIAALLNIHTTMLADWDTREGTITLTNAQARTLLGLARHGVEALGGSDHDQFRRLDNALNGSKPVHVDTGEGVYIVRSLDDTGHALVIYLGAPT